jgi:hypothetical protein
VTDLPIDSPPELRVEISPRPTEDERDALVAALAVVLSAHSVEFDQTSVEVPASRWAEAGREAAFAARDLRTRRSR